MAPFELLTFTKSIEKKMKRVKTIFNGPRDMDIDILLYDDEIIHTPELVIPHPRMLDRAFVLAPLSEIAPNLIVLGRSIKDTLEIFDDVQVRKRG
jgi:2-amino-4-hydroxy-6-hydroxymethyldihydropteridine diphosphokinase